MKFRSALASTLLAGSLGTAFAADLPVKAPPLPVVAPIYNWTGFYIGGNAGGSWSSDNVSSYTIDATPVALPGSITNRDLNGFLGGGQIGYNWQIKNIVLGVEADGAWRHNDVSTVMAFPDGLDFSTFESRQDWLVTLRPRVGVTAGNWLFYATGGAAAEGIEHSFIESRPTFAGANRTISSDDTRWGWTVGAGIEAGWGHWSAGLEYLYADFGRTTTLAAPAQVLGGVTFNPSVLNFDDSAQHIVRVKVNYHFGGPVIARY